LNAGRRARPTQDVGAIAPGMVFATHGAGIR